MWICRRRRRSRAGADDRLPEATESRFGTLSVTSDGYRYDLARTRSERYPSPARCPMSRPPDRRRPQPPRLHRQCSRRRSHRPAAGELIAVDNALEDLDARQLAVLHDRSFEDDPTRLLRLARYAARLGFDDRAAHPRPRRPRPYETGALDTISGTRIGNELRLLANEPDPVAAFEAAAALGLAVVDRRRHLARAALAALLPTTVAPTSSSSLASSRSTPAEPACYRARPPGLHRRRPRRDRRGGHGAPALAQRLAKATSRAEIGRTVGTAGIETVALASAQGSPSQSLLWLQDLRNLHIQINGEDLIQNGIPEGPSNRAMRFKRPRTRYWTASPPTATRN